MDISRFINNYNTKQDKSDKAKDWEIIDNDLDELISQYGGYMIDSGFFKIQSYNTAKNWTKIVVSSFPKYKDKVVIFGFDWLGRQYGKGLNRNIIYRFDISTGDDFELEQTIDDFFNIELVDFADDSFLHNDFCNWIYGQNDLEFNEIVGFKIPLWLGGKDEIENYERIDCEVDWGINYQLMQKIK